MLIKYHSDKIEQPNKYVLIIVNITNQLYGLFERKRERSERREKGNGSVSRWSFLPEREGILLFLYSFGTSVWGSLSNEICLCFFRFLVVVFLGGLFPGLCCYSANFWQIWCCAVGVSSASFAREVHAWCRWCYFRGVIGQIGQMLSFWLPSGYMRLRRR